MRGYSKLTIVGNLGADPEMRYTPEGTAVVDLRVAVNTRRREGEELIDEVNWFGVSAWGSMAESANTYLKKGDPVMVQGRFFARQYEGKDKTIKTSLDIRADDILYLSAPETEGEKPAAKAPAKQYARPAARR